MSGNPFANKKFKSDLAILNIIGPAMNLMMQLERDHGPIKKPVRKPVPVNAGRDPAVIRFHASKRRCAQLQRTPPWADLDAMRAIYAKAQRLTLETGIAHHVDHEIPLQGRLVSGLHVPNNLQILTGSENSRKRNRFEVEA